MAEEVNSESSRNRVAPAAYVPFKTFLTAVDSLRHGIPGQIDRTIWRNQSGVIQSQILMAFRFFSLVNEEDQPTPALQRLVDHPEKRPEQIRSLLLHAYRSLVERDLTRMTPGMLAEAMEEYNVSGDTKRKAISFFLQAARFAEVPMHPLLSGQMRGPTGSRRRRPAKSAATPVVESQPFLVGDPTGRQAGSVKTVELRSGGKISLNVLIDVFSTSAEDREFVFDLIDRLQRYENTPEIELRIQPRE